MPLYKWHVAQAPTPSEQRWHRNLAEPVSRKISMPVPYMFHTSLNTWSLVGATSALWVGCLLLAVNPFWLALQWNPFWLCARAVVCAVCLFSLTVLRLLFCLVWKCIYIATLLSPDLVSIGVHTLCLQTWSPYLWNRPWSPYPIVCQSHMF